MKKYLTELSQRERNLLGLGTLIVALVLLWLLVYRPISTHIDQQVVRKQQLQEQLNIMQQAVGQIRPNQAQSRVPLPADKTFSAWLDGQLSQLNLQQAVKRSEPIDENTVTLWLQSVPFDRIADWLQSIHQKHGVVVDQADINVVDRSLGLVTLRIRITTS